MEHHSTYCRRIRRNCCLFKSVIGHIVVADYWLFVFFVFVFILPGPAFAEMIWTTGRNISTTPESSISAAIAVAGDTVHLTWMDRYSVDKAAIYYKRSINGGFSWETTTHTIATDAHDSIYPAIAADGDDVHIVWMQKSSYGTWRIYHARSNTAGKTWYGSQALTPYNESHLFPKVTVQGSHVYAVWVSSDNTSVGFQIYFASSNDSGVTWSSPQLISSEESINYSSYPDIAVTGNTVHVVWTYRAPGNEVIRYRSSIDGGSNWNPIQDISAVYEWGVYSPSISVTGSAVHVAWSAYIPGGNWEVLYNHSTNNGTSWGSDVNLSNDIGSTQAPKILSDGSHISVMWQVQTPPPYEFPEEPSNSTFDVMYIQSTDGGTTWGGSRTFSTTGGAPTIAGNATAIHMAWHDTSPGNSDIFYAVGQDCAGRSWEATQNLSNNEGDSSYADIGVNGDNVHVVWSDKTYNSVGNHDIYYRRSTDGGLSWANMQRLDNLPTRSSVPRIAVDGQTLHVVWAGAIQYTNEGEIYYTQSTDNGLTWSTPQIIADSPGWAFYPTLAVSGNTIHVAWLDINNNQLREIRYSKSSDSGASWSAPQNMSNSNVDSDYPKIASDGDTVHLVWQERVSTGNDEVYLRRSVDGGTTWSAIENISANDRGSALPDIVAAGSHLHIVWGDQINPYTRPRILHRRSSDNGATWAPRASVTVTDGQDYRPALARYGNNVHLVWRQIPSATPSQVYYNESRNGGDTWDGWACQQNLSNNDGESIFPRVATNGETIHVVWTDDSPGNADILYKRTTVASGATTQTMLSKCVRFPWLCSNVKLVKNIIKLKCDIAGCINIAPLPTQWPEDQRLPAGRSGSAYSASYILLITGLENDWDVGLFDPKGLAIPHRLTRTREGIVLQVSLPKIIQIGHKIPSYLLAFELKAQGNIGVGYRAKLQFRTGELSPLILGK